MKKGLLKKMVLGSLSILGVLIIVLCIHIYIVTRPKPIDEHTVAMARIDFKQDISRADAEKIAAWLYQQKGIDHVVINPATRIGLFTFFPVKNTADKIIAGLMTDLPYKGVRYLPSAKELKGGCPVAANSFSYRAYSFIKNIF